MKYRCTRAVVVALLVPGIVACGQKGPLVVPPAVHETAPAESDDVTLPDADGGETPYEDFDIEEDNEQY